MRSKDRCPILVTPLLMALLVLPALQVLGGTAQAQGVGVLEGQVVNGTAGGPGVGSGLAVTLHILQGDAEVGSLETTTDADGRFRFEGLDTDASLEYWPEATYLDVAYSPDAPVQFQSDQTSLDAQINAFETTEDDSTIRLGSVHIIVESFGEVLRISEIHLFGNDGDRTYIGSEGDASQGTVYLPLPDGAVGLAFGEGEPENRFLQVAGGLLDTEPVPPGQDTSLIFFSYHVMAGEQFIPLERSFAYPVTVLSLLVAQPGLTLSSEQLEARGLELFQGRQYELHMTQGFAPDTPLIMGLTPVEGALGTEDTGGMPLPASGDAAGAAPQGNQGVLGWLGLALAGLAVAGVVVYAVATRRPAPTVASGPRLERNPQARRLLSDLADLEDAREAGEVDEDTYERRRTELHDELKAL